LSRYDEVFMPEHSIAELLSAYRSGRLTCEQVITEYRDTIAQWDGEVNAVIALNPDALRQARQLDYDRLSGKPLQSLHGIPVLIKDNIDTQDPMPTTAGSLALTDNFATQDATVVARLRDAGAIILGKTNLSEWANFRGNRSISGWSSAGGLTRNPHVLNRSACGSSSGSGAAVAANFCVVAVGTETDGSIICPAQTNGIVGVKPTLGWVSRTGIIPIAASQDTAGPMARTVTDAAVLLAVMAGADPLDLSTDDSKGRTIDFTSRLNQQSLVGARIGIARQWSSKDPRLVQHLDSCIAVLEAAGAEVIKDLAAASSDAFSDAELAVLYYEYKAGLNQYLAGTPDAVPVRCIEDLIAWNEAHHHDTLRYFGQEHLIAASQKGDLSSPEYLQALAFARQKAGTEGIDALLHHHQLDAIVTLSGGPAWSIDMVLGDNHASDIDSTSAAAVSGNPHVTVPSGLVSGLPVGLSFIGAAWQDDRLLGLAYAFEQRMQGRVTPTFKKALEP
jgi:amidase